MKKIQMIFLVLALTSSIARADYFDDIHEYLSNSTNYNNAYNNSNGGNGNGGGSNGGGGGGNTPNPINPDANLQQCHDNLGAMMDNQGNTLMNNTCTPDVVFDDQVYVMRVFFLQPYQFDEECLALEVIFGSEVVSEGPGLLDQWQFDSQSQTIEWIVRHDDLVSTYNCQFTESNFEFEWECDFYVNIFLQGKLQQTYSSKLKITIDRLHREQLTVNIEKNVIDALCCENELQIETRLRFCTSFACNAYLADNQQFTFVRKDDIYLEHSIITPGFQDYVLQHVAVTLGSIFPNIVQFAEEQGRVRIHIQSFIAMDNSVLSVISRIQKPGTLRRFLQDQQEIGDNYKLKGSMQISIVDPVATQEEFEKTQFVEKSKVYQNKQAFSEEDDNGLMTIAIVAVSVLVFMLVLGVVYCLKFGSKKQNKYLDDKEKDTENNNNKVQTETQDKLQEN